MADIELNDFDQESLHQAVAHRLYQVELDTFFREQLKVQTKGMGLTPLVPNPVQVPLVASMQKQLDTIGKIRQIWFKCRQPGGSTLAAGTCFQRTSLFPNVYTFTIAQDKTTVGRLFEMHDIFYSSMTPDVRPMRQYFSKGTEVVFGNPDLRARDDNPGLRSKILVGEAKNINVGTGQTIHCLHMSEVARYPSSSSITESLIPALSSFPGTVQIIESTAHYAPGAAWFRDQCERAMKGSSEFVYHFLEWWRMPEYSLPCRKGEIRKDSEEQYLAKTYGLTDGQIKWRRSMIDFYKGDVDSFKMNYPFTFEEAWVAKQTSTFPRDRLMEMRSMLRPPTTRYHIDVDNRCRMYEDPEGEFSVWFEPEPGKEYDVGGDVGAGESESGAQDGDPSVAEVFERGVRKQVAEWRGYCLPRQFGDILATIGKKYNTAQVAPEINDWGHSTLDRLREIYANIYVWRRRDTQTMKFTNLLGWKTAHDTKNIIVNLMREKIWLRQIQIFSEVLWQEMLVFARDYTPTGMVTYAAFPGFHDDCIMAAMIALQISDDEDFGKAEALDEAHKKAVVTKYLDPAKHDVDGLNPVRKESWQLDIEAWK